MKRFRNNTNWLTVLLCFVILPLTLSFKRLTPIDLAGTVWRYYGNGEYDTYLIKFKSGGGIEMEHPADVTPKNDGWEQKGKKLLFWYNDHFVDYQGKMISPSLIRGKCTNVRGDSWGFELRRENSGESSESEEIAYLGTIK